MENSRPRPAKAAPPYPLSSVDHALALAVILQVEGPQTVSTAAARLGVARSTAHRLLAMLVYRDFAVQRADRSYGAGPVLSLAATSRSRTARLREVSLPHLETLAERVGESVNLVIRAGTHTRFVATVESHQMLRVGSREGMVFPAHLTSGGQVLLADLDPADVEALYQHRGAGPDEPTRIADGMEIPRPDLEALHRRLARVRDLGFAVNVEGAEAGVTAIGVPIRDDQGRAEAALAVSLPSIRFSQDRVPALLAAMRECTQHVESDLAQWQEGHG